MLGHRHTSGWGSAKGPPFDFSNQPRAKRVRAWIYSRPTINSFFNSIVDPVVRHSSCSELYDGRSHVSSETGTIHLRGRLPSSHRYIRRGTCAIIIFRCAVTYLIITAIIPGQVTVASSTYTDGLGGSDQERYRANGRMG